MRQISRRDLYALGEPFGEGATHARAGDGRRVMGGGGSAVQITNWGRGNADMMTPWQQSVWANSKDAATEQAKDNAEYRKWYAQQNQAQREWYASQKSNEILWQQAAMIAVKTAIDLVIADQMDKRMREIAKDQRDMADRQMKIGEELHARYIKKFTPIEDSLADFAKTDWETNRYKPQYAMQQGRAKLDAGRAFSKVAAKLNKKFARYCTGANAEMLRQVHTDWARIEVDMVNRAWRDEENRMYARDDVQWGRLINAINVGLKLPTQASQDIAAGIATATQSNAIRGQAMQGWYGALARGASGLFQFGYGALEQQRAAQFAQLPGMARGGSLGDAGYANSVLQSSYGYNEGNSGVIVGEPMSPGSVTGTALGPISDPITSTYFTGNSGVAD